MWTTTCSCISSASRPCTMCDCHDCTLPMTHFLIQLFFYPMLWVVTGVIRAMKDYIRSHVANLELLNKSESLLGFGLLKVGTLCFIAAVHTLFLSHCSVLLKICQIVAFQADDILTCSIFPNIVAGEEASSEIHDKHVWQMGKYSLLITEQMLALISACKGFVRWQTKLEIFVRHSEEGLNTSPFEKYLLINVQSGLLWKTIIVAYLSVICGNHLESGLPSESWTISLTDPWTSKHTHNYILNIHRDRGFKNKMD